MAIAPSTAALATDGLLASLDPEQRAAAMLPDGPAQVIAPAGSGKTTTLIARLGVLLGRGVAADRIAVVTFNRDAAAELAARIAARLAPHVAGAEAIEVRTLHAMGRQVLIDAGRPVRLAGDRLPLLRAARRRALAELPVLADGDDPPPEPPDAAALDTIVSAWKVEGRPPPRGAESAVRAFTALMEAHGLIDFDDLVVEAVAALEADPQLRRRWQGRFSHICVDEFQDVDAAQLRLIRILAAPEDNLFVVGDDDQTIYAWRLADVRRILEFPNRYPDARRVILEVNYRCPAAVVAAADRLIATNRERVPKQLRAAVPGPQTHAAVPITTWALRGPGSVDELAAILPGWAAEAGKLAVLARTRAELGPLILALLRNGIPHATSVPSPLQAEPVEALIADLASCVSAAPPLPALLRARALRGWRRADLADRLGEEELAALDALIGWAVGHRRSDAFLAAFAEARARLAALRDPDAAIELATVHGAKGREWPTVVVLGMEIDRFPNRRAVTEASDPGRALEEERRLAYVAITRCRRNLVLAFDPDRASPFVAEMMGRPERGRAATYRPTSGATVTR
ncbi:MAG: ATP-dependent helicase [Chloroflexota bacterium]